MNHGKILAEPSAGQNKDIRAIYERKVVKICIFANLFRGLEGVRAHHFLRGCDVDNNNRRA